MLNSRKMYLSRAASAEHRRGKNWSRLPEEAVMKKPPLIKTYKRGVFFRFFRSDAIWVLRSLDIHSIPIYLDLLFDL